MDKAMELIEQLAAKLGVAVEYLWTTLVRQQIAEGITCVVMAGLAIVVLILIGTLAPRIKKSVDKKYKELVDDRRKNGTGYCGSHSISSLEEDRYNNMSTAITVLSIIFAIVAVIVFSICVPLGIQQLVNPEYFAFTEVLYAI